MYIIYIVHEILNISHSLFIIVSGKPTMEILSIIYKQYIYFGPLFVFVLALSKLISKQRLRINYFYSLSYLFMGLGMLQVVSYSMKPYPGYWYVSHLLIPFTFGTPLFLYLRFRFLIQGITIRVHPVIPVVFSFIALYIIAGPVFGGGAGFIKEHAELRPLLDQSFLNLPVYYKVVHIINFSGKIILCAGLLTLLIKTMYLWQEIEKERSMQARIAYIFTIMMFLTSVLGLTGDLVSFEFSKAAIAMVNSVTLGVFLASQYDPGYYAIFKHLRQKKKYAVSKVRGIDVMSVIEQLSLLMDENQLYLEEKLSIKDVAEMLDINHQQLSEILNRELGKSFSSYVNDIKISEAKKLLINEPDLPVIRIAMSVGFNSIRTFNRVFVNSTGVTPMEYRNSRLKK